jgi:hypothetical protein
MVKGHVDLGQHLQLFLGTGIMYWRTSSLTASSPVERSNEVRQLSAGEIILGMSYIF